MNTYYTRTSHLHMHASLAWHVHTRMFNNDYHIRYFVCIENTQGITPLPTNKNNNTDREHVQ
jgi:hypothetical protein